MSPNVLMLQDTPNSVLNQDIIMFMSEEIELKEGLSDFVREGQLTNRSVLSFLQHKIGELKKSDYDSVINMFFASGFIFLSFSLEDGRRVPIF
jgi:hypothetical protein